MNKFHEALLEAKRSNESDDVNARAPLSPKRHGSNPPESPKKSKGKAKAVKLASNDENHQTGFIDLSSSLRLSILFENNTGRVNSLYCLSES